MLWILGGIIAYYVAGAFIMVAISGEGPERAEKIDPLLPFFLLVSWPVVLFMFAKMKIKGDL